MKFLTRGTAILALLFPSLNFHAKAGDNARFPRIPNDRRPHDRIR